MAISITSDSKEKAMNKYVTRVKLFTQLKTYGQHLSATFDSSSMVNTFANAANSSVDLASIAKELQNALPKEYLTAKMRDTTLGGNEVINPLPQFCEYDDVIHPLNRTMNTSYGGMGRVYDQIFDSQQKILYVTCGTPDYTNAADFIKKMYNADLARLMNEGGGSPNSKDASALAQFIGFSIGKVIAIPRMAIKWLKKTANNSVIPSRYYDFLPTQSLFYQTVNTILAHFAINMNLIADDGKNDPNNLPLILREHGLDALTILNRKYQYDKLKDATKDATTVGYLNKLVADKNYERDSIWYKLKEGAASGFTQANMFFGLRINNTVDSTESASNTTKEPAILSKINAQVAAGRERTFNMSAFANTSVGSFFKTLYTELSAVVEGISNQLHFEGGLEIFKGSGYVDIPEIYASSSFHKSYNLHFQLRSIGGDPLSIFYRIYFPLAFLLAMSFPRSVGQNSYTSPFLIRMYSPGLVSLPLGMVESITLKRGDNEHGWNDGMLPLQIDVNMSIKDLSPVMHIALSSGKVDEIFDLLGTNSTFQEYMLTLSGTNVAQYLNYTDNIKRRFEILKKISYNNRFNPLMIGNMLATHGPGRIVTFFTPTSRLPGATNISNK